MKKQFSSIYLLLACGLIYTVITAGNCGKDDVPLPQIGGYNNSNEVAAGNLLAHWGFDGNGNERKTNTAPTASANATFSATGVKGQAVTLNKGYLYYASELTKLTTSKAYTVTAWVQVSNNQGTGPGNEGVQIFYQNARPGTLFGNVSNFFETTHFVPASDTLRMKSLYADQGGGYQDNINAFGPNAKVVKAAGGTKWVKVTTTYEPFNATTNYHRIYADTTEVALDYFNRGAQNFKYTGPSEVIIGGWYNNIPGKQVSTDTWTIPFTGKIDELRVYDKALTIAELTALYKLEMAGR